MAVIKYTDEHEWISIEGDVGTIGISAYAQEQLGDVVFVEVPDVGKKVKKGGDMAVVESVKAASDVYAPAGGTVVAVNTALDNAPETVNADPYSAGWILKIKLADAGEAAALMDAAAYAKATA